MTVNKLGCDPMLSKTGFVPFDVPFDEASDVPAANRRNAADKTATRLLAVRLLTSTPLSGLGQERLYRSKYNPAC